MTKTAIVLIAQSSEEIEFTVTCVLLYQCKQRLNILEDTYDIFVRAGIQVTSALVGPGIEGGKTVKCSRGVVITPDAVFDDISDEDVMKYDILVIPGGQPGANTISQTERVQKVVRSFLEEEKIVGMICAASLTALTSKLPLQPLTSHPSVKSQLESSFEYKDEHVVVSGTLVTSRGPGTTFAFALRLVQLALGNEKVAEVAGPLMLIGSCD